MDTKVIKPGVVETGRRIKGGFNLNKFVKELLRSMGFADTVDCCTYYPTAPTVTVATASSPTDQEISELGIPLGAMFKTTDGSSFYLYMVGQNGSATEIVQA